MTDVDVQQFWEIVEAARSEVDGWPGDHDRRWARALYARLSTLPPEDILGFDRCFAAVRRSAESPEMAAAVQLVVLPTPATWLPYFVSFEAKFSNFVNCLVMLGRDTFDRAVADPDTLAEHPLIRDVAEELRPGAALLAVRVFDAAGDAYCALTGTDTNEYLDLVLPSTVDDQAEEDQEDEEDPDEDDEDDGSYDAWVAEHLPRLWALFVTDCAARRELPG
jgi:uncharacterized protein DUF4240